ncbi:unnamed protein product [Sphagnum jensenii]|uniref:Uncharacterized protein n=1 Tax=Sphagnum jensenii TaxID=128206 RepID=A0ABP1AKG2_9BRYO
MVPFSRCSFHASFPSFQEITPFSNEYSLSPLASPWIVCDSPSLLPPSPPPPVLGLFVAPPVFFVVVFFFFFFFSFLFSFLFSSSSSSSFPRLAASASTKKIPPEPLTTVLQPPSRAIPEATTPGENTDCCLLFCMGEESKDRPPSLDPNPYKILQHRRDKTTLKQAWFVRSPIRITTTQPQWSAYSSLSLSLSLLRQFLKPKTRERDPNASGSQLLHSLLW